MNEQARPAAGASHCDMPCARECEASSLAAGRAGLQPRPEMMNIADGCATVSPMR